MKVLFVASECVPFVKTGGLADVVGSLSAVMNTMGVDARVILPLYRTIDAQYRDRMEHVTHFDVHLGWRTQYCGIETLVENGVRFYFVDNLYYFGRPYVYGGMDASEAERFSFFSRAVMDAMPHLDFMPDVLHLNDWQTGMIPPMLNIQYRHLPFYKDIRCVMTIHNLQYQGIFSCDFIEEMLGLGWEHYTEDKLEFYGGCNFLKSGLVYSDVITTVSPKYAQEIQTGYYGERLDGLLRARSASLHGVLNGLDIDDYNPETDKYIEKNFSIKTLNDKAQNKLALQRELGLPESKRTPLIGMVGRLSSQKGLDLVERVLPEIVEDGTQLAVLGLGEPHFMDLFSWAAQRFSDNIAARLEMNNALAHKIYAGADMFLMPSLFEPCGLAQMMAMRYGTLPIVRETGGLHDTVIPYNEYNGEGNGFSFTNYNAHDMLNAINLAKTIYRKKTPTWRKLMREAMRGDFSWNHSAQKYLEIYSHAIE